MPFLTHAELWLAAHSDAARGVFLGHLRSSHGTLVHSSHGGVTPQLWSQGKSLMVVVRAPHRCISQGLPGDSVSAHALKGWSIV